MKKNLFWIVPLVLVLILAGVVLSIPPFVASNTHRGSIEALASSLTGRTVHITGTLSVALFPNPRLSATQVTITGPDEETISARSLTVNISLPALLRGRLLAEALELDGPVIVFPWPLPGGPRAIAPPGWLAALHAQIDAGDISLGAARFRDVNADIVTGGSGTVDVSGTGTIFGRNVTLNLAIGAGELTGAAPVAVNASSGDAAMSFKGALNAQSVLSGQFGLNAPELSGTAELVAGGASANAADLQFTAGKASITGTAEFNFDHPEITAELDVRNLDLDLLPPQLPPIPISVTLTASNLVVDGKNLPGLTGDFQASPNGAAASDVELSLPAGARVNGHGKIDSDGAVSGAVSLDSPDLPDMLENYGFAPPSDWTAATLGANFSGTTRDVAITGLHGTLGASHVTGDLRLTGDHVAGALDFDQLDLLPVLAALGRLPAGAFTADGQVTAAAGSLGPVPLEHLLFDCTFDTSLILRRVFANVFGGMAAGSISLDANGQVEAARGFVFVPSAAPLSALLPARWQLPAALVKPRLNAAIFAQQRSGWLATSVIASLGDFEITAAPAFDAAGQTAEGAVTLRHPDAIAAFKLAGLPAGLGWPGPGSISLRAGFMASPDAVGLQDFVLSLGSLTANGRVMLNQHNVFSGNIDAGTLALPPLSPDWQIPWNALASARGGFDIAADRVLYDGNTILLGSQGAVRLAPDVFSLSVTNAALAGGDASGSLTATVPQAKPPAIAVKFAASGVDASRLDLPIKFPFAVSAGTLGGTASLTASGYAPKVWLATLGGSASMTGSNGSLAGFDLAGLGKALRSKTPARDMRAALAAGTTPFASLSAVVNISQGNATLGGVSLSGPEGTASATGSVDVFDQDVAIRLALRPKVLPPISIGTMLLGSWAAPREYPKLKAALAWKPAAPKSAAPKLGP